MAHPLESRRLDPRSPVRRRQCRTAEPYALAPTGRAQNHASSPPERRPEPTLHRTRRALPWQARKSEMDRAAPSRTPEKDARLAPHKGRPLAPRTPATNRSDAPNHLRRQAIEVHHLRSAEAPEASDMRGRDAANRRDQRDMVHDPTPRETAAAHAGARLAPHSSAGNTRHE